MTREEAERALAGLRERIDAIDRELIALVNERTRVVEDIGRMKRELNLAIYEPKREEQVFANVAAHNTGPLPADAAKRIFERIIDEMRSVQRLRMLAEKKKES